MVYNNLFNEKKMEEFISFYDESLVINSPDDDPICNWIQKLNNNELEDEKKNYANFLMIILDKLLGYRVDDINFESDIGDEGRPVEFTFKKGDKEYVVVELKGTKTEDLNKRYNRGQSAIEQVTNYASIKEETQWAFVSNYNEFRLFNPNFREKYISFKFKSLTDPEVLKKFLLIFSKFSLIEEDIPQTLLKETRIIERELEDEFYQLFSETRLMLIKELEQSSEDIGRIEAIRLAQLILNRYIFICFAEDLKLIPSETTADVLITPIEKKNLFEYTMWDRLNELFRFMDKGNEIRGIGAFNGGLFKENLRNLEIRDFIEDLHFYDDCYKKWKFEEKYDEMTNLLGEYKDKLNPIYKNLLIISSFDFGSELSVNILGHIFENSIGDIEELKDQTKKRRKKDGVFYTPEPITDYISRNTIIPYLSHSGEVNTVHELITEYEQEDNLEELDKKLKEIKIVDPACGSGAFLNKAVDVLFEIHENLHDSMYAEDTSLDQYFDSVESRRQIISDNIYGVDLNEESVEITKLSLFLKLATSAGIKKGFKLPNLDKNIKCGNSVIDDESVVGNKTFHWEEEFKDIFNDGGFDVIGGNPPYVRHELIQDDEKTFLSENYETCTDSTNLYVSFFERSGIKIFQDVAVDPCVIVITKDKTDTNEILIDGDYIIPQKALTDELWYFSDIEKIALREKLLNKGTPLKDISSMEINNGIKTGFNDAFYIDEETKNQLILEDGNNSKIIKPLVVGKDIGRYNINFEKMYLIFSRQGIEIDDYPSIKNHLSKFIEDLTPKKHKDEEGKGRKPGNYKWYEIQDKTDFYENFEKPKLIWAEMNKEISFCYDDKGYYVNNKCFFITSDEIDLKYLNGLFLSKLYKFLFKAMSSSLGKETVEMRKSYIKKVPILHSEHYEKVISSEVSIILEKNKLLSQEIRSFQNWLRRTFGIDTLSKKLENYYELNFEEFLQEIKKEKSRYHTKKNSRLIGKRI